MLLEWIFWGVGIIALIFCSGALVSCEFALVKLRYDPLEHRDLESLRLNKWLWRMIDRSDSTARILRFSRTGCTLGLGILFLGFFKDIQGAYSPTSDFSVIALAVVAFAVSLVFHYLFVELLPRGWALKDPAGILRFAFPVVLIFEVITWPFMALLRMTKVRLFQVVGLNAEDDLNPLDVEVQIRALGEETPGLSKVVRSIINRTLQMRDLYASDVLLPRKQVIIFDTEDSIQENVELARKHGHTRYPLCEGDLDQCLGIIHIKDLFRYRRDLSTLDLKRMCRPIVRFQENEPLERVFQRMLNYKMHMALVQDEFGGILGVITLERILEVLVGEIQDEFDAEENLIVRLGAGRFRVSGLTPIHDLEKELGTLIETMEVATFGGLITAEIGQIPETGQKIKLDNLEIVIREVDETRVISTLVTVVEPEEPVEESSN